MAREIVWWRFFLPSLGSAFLWFLAFRRSHERWSKLSRAGSAEVSQIEGYDVDLALVPALFEPAQFLTQHGDRLAAFSVHRARGTVVADQFADRFLFRSSKVSSLRSRGKYASRSWFSFHSRTPGLVTPSQALHGLAGDRLCSGGEVCPHNPFQIKPPPSEPSLANPNRFGGDPTGDEILHQLAASRGLLRLHGPFPNRGPLLGQARSRRCPDSPQRPLRFFSLASRTKRNPIR